MDRPDFEHLLRAAAAITGQNEFVLIGSQSLLGQFPNAPSELRTSDELDLIGTKPSLPGEPPFADLVDGTIGELSPFHRTFGYYGHGVGFETAIFPEGWKDRAVRVRTPDTGGATGICMEVHDLAASKLAAGRPKDLMFVGQLLQHGLLREDIAAERIAMMPVDSAMKATLGSRLVAARQMRTS